MHTMKRDQRTIKLYDRSHRMASKLSNRFGISMAAVVEIAVHELSKRETLELPARNGVRKVSARRVLRPEMAAAGVQPGKRAA